jgi:hypothetical protein
MYVSHDDKLYAGTERRQRYSSHSLATLSLEGGGWSAIYPTSFTHRKDLVLVLQEARWVSGLVWVSNDDYRG